MLLPSVERGKKRGKKKRRFGERVCSVVRKKERLGLEGKKRKASSNFLCGGRKGGLTGRTCKSISQKEEKEVEGRGIPLLTSHSSRKGGEKKKTRCSGSFLASDGGKGKKKEKIN